MRKLLFDKTILATSAAAITIFSLDLTTPWGMGEWMIYFIPLIFTPYSRQFWYPVWYAIICSILIGIGFFFPEAPTAPFALEIGLQRRLIAVLVLWAMALFLVQRKRAETERREMQERFSSFMNNSSTVAWMKDEGFNYVYTNEPFQHFFQKKSSDLIGKNDYDFWPKPVADELRAHDQQVFSSGKHLETYEMVPDPNGEAHHWLVRKFPFKDAADRKFVGGIAVDVTERKRVEEALRNSELRFRSVWDSSADGMRLTDQEGKIVAVNKAYCKLSGMTEAQLVGQPLSVTYDCDSDEVLRIYRERFAARSIPALLERTVEFRTGQTLDVEFANSFIELEGQPPLCLGIFRDVSSRKKHEDQRIALERKLLDGQKLESLGVLAGGIAHDFNNLLTGVLGNAGLCLMQTSEVSPVRGYMENIEKICLQAADLCKQMLAYSGRGHFIIQEIDLNILVGEMTQLLKISIAKKVVLKFDLADNLPSIKADAAQIRQVLMNLIINASEAIGEQSGVISIRTGVMRADTSYLSETYLSPELPEGDYAYLEVADSGCGMSAATKAKIFDPFYTTKFTGRGLGLAAVLGIVRGHNGSLKVYSELGRGTTFKLLIPCSTVSAPLSEQTKSLSEKWRGTGTILVVDDEESVRTIAARMLELFGFSTILANDGRQGVEAFRANKDKIAAVILDMTMPHLNGEEAFREIRRINSDARVLLVSGYNEQDATDRFAGKGLDGFLQKPFKPDDLRDKLRAILES
jgi:two-component system cell cycle sensor histidine kinase/response regulator CckA